MSTGAGPGGPSGRSLHATCLAVGERGVLIRGPSGSGKSTLARHVLVLAGLQGRFARLVADDRVVIAVAHGRLVAGPHPAIGGLLEMRGVGLLTEPFEAAVRLALVVDCAPDAPRLPAPEELAAVIEGVALPRLAGPPGLPLAALILETAHGRAVTAAATA